MVYLVDTTRVLKLFILRMLIPAFLPFCTSILGSKSHSKWICGTKVFSLVKRLGAHMQRYTSIYGYLESNAGIDLAYALPVTCLICNIVGKITAFHTQISYSGHHMSNSKGPIHHHIPGIKALPLPTTLTPP